MHMTAVWEFLEGKKSYLVAFIAAAVGLTTAIVPDFTVPEWAWWILSAAGLGAVRAAIPPKA
jgi:hypothetical protein